MTKKIRSAEDLNALRDQARGDIELRTGEKETRITVHMGTCGIAAGARDVLAALASELSLASVTGVTLKQSGCAGLCEQEPMMTVEDKTGRPYRYGRLDRNKVREIVKQHLLSGSPVVEFMVNT